MVLELAAFEAKEDPARLADRVPALFEIANNKTNDKYWHRGQAMKLLEKAELTGEQEAQLEELLMAELDAANRDKHRSNLGSAVEILLARPDRDRYWDQLAEAGPQADHYTSYGALINALAELAAEGPPERRKALEATVRNRLANNKDGMVNDALRAALALDLRGLKEDLQKRATSGPEVPNGDAAEYSGGRFKGTEGERYHLARVIVALWSEPDAKVRARMWIALALGDSYYFDPKFQSTVSVKLREQAEKGIAVLSPAERIATVNALLKAMKFEEPMSSVVEWLKGVGKGS